jgi:hypothetical protein
MAALTLIRRQEEKNKFMVLFDSISQHPQYGADRLLLSNSKRDESQ